MLRFARFYYFVSFFVVILGCIGVCSYAVTFVLLHEINFFKYIGLIICKSFNDLTLSLESNLIFKLVIFCCNVSVFKFYQHPIFVTVLLIFSEYYSNFSCSVVRFLSDGLIAFQIFQKLMFPAVLRVYGFA